MAVDSSALNLAQYALMSNDPLVRRVAFSLIEHGSVLQDIPLVTRQTLIMNGVRFQGDSLPAVNWAKINEEPTVVTATPTPFQEQAYMIRNAIDTDRRLVQDENAIVDPRGARLSAYLRAVAYDVNDKFIGNVHLTGDPDAPVGLRSRLDNPTVYGCESECKVDAGAVNLSDGGMTAATANTFLTVVDNLLDNLGASDGAGVVLYCNENMKRRWARAIRVLGSGAGFSQLQDAFDRPVDVYKGARVRVIGRKKDQSTQIITSTETAAGVDGADAHTSIYGVRYGEDGMLGWQFEDLGSAVRDLGLLDNGVTYRTVVDWAVGLYQAHTRAIGRLYGIKVA